MTEPSTDFDQVKHRDRRPVLSSAVLTMDVPRVSSESSEFFHAPVLLAEVVGALANVPAGVIVDATVGGAGHGAAILDDRADVVLHGFDQDADAVAVARRRLDRFGPRAFVHHERFDRVIETLDELGVAEIAGFLMDLGVSSPQLDRPERGFSYRSSGPLDMRMDPRAELTAAAVVNSYSAAELVDVLRSYGDERHAPRIASAIVENRPLTTTADLAEVISGAVPAAARRKPGHPAKRSFQAIRIEVNAELAILGETVSDLIERLATGGVGLVLTYHSGEDRIVKDRMRRAVDGDDLPGMPTTSAHEWAWRGAKRPGEGELHRNPRAASARLRAVRRRSVDS